MSQKFLDLAGLTAYDRMLKEWFKAGVVDITDEAIKSLFVTPTLYEAVDLGLPSGIKWADRNVGAETPQDYGLYFSWGNVDGHAVDENGNITDGYSFDKATYATTSGGQSIKDLDAEHDAATVNMGSNWRMPTPAETFELVKNTDHYYIVAPIFGEGGNMVVGPFDYPTKPDSKGLSGPTKKCSICFVKKGEEFNYNVRGNFIEFPFTGNCYESSLINTGTFGAICTSNFEGEKIAGVHNLRFYTDGKLEPTDILYRSECFVGFPVRGVHA